MITVLAGFIMCRIVCAAEGQVPLTLADAVHTALADSEQVQAASARAQAARYAAGQARSWANPEVGFGAGPRTVDGVRGTTIEAEVSQPLWTMGKRGLRGRIADTEAARVDVQAESTRSDVTAAVIRLAVEYALARQRAAFSQDRQQRFELVQEYLGGHVFASPQRKAESRVVADRLRNATADNVSRQAAVHAAFARLNVYLRLPASVLPVIAVPWLKGEAKLDEATWRAKALERNQVVRMQSLTATQAGESLRLASREAWPDIAATAFYRHSSAVDDEREVGAGLSMPFPLFNRNGGARHSLERQRDAEALLLRLNRRQLEADVAVALIGVAAAQENARAYPASLLPELDGHLREGDGEFQRSRVDILTYLELDAETAETFGRALDAQRDLVEAALTLLTLSAEDDMSAALAGF